MTIAVTRLAPGDAALACRAISPLKITDPAVRAALHTGTLERFLARETNILLLARDGAEPIGYLVAYLLDRVDRDQTMMHFYEIGVAMTHRRQGVGTALIARLKSICRENGVMKMWVSTNRSNTMAMSLYSAAGAVADRQGDEVSFTWSTAEDFNG